MIAGLPEFEFVIFTIGAQESQRGEFRYKLPDNVTEVKETFLDSYLREDGVWGKRFRLTPEQKQALGSMLGGSGNTDWPRIFDLLRTPKFRRAADFLMSKDYFDILKELCQEKYNQVPFTEMFWTVRSMVLPLFLTLRHEVPEADLYHSVSTGYAGVVGGLAKHVYGKPLVLTEHGIYSREREEEIIKAGWVKGYFKDLWIQYFYRLSGCAYGFSDRVITLFNRNREIEIELGCDPGKISIVPNGVNPADYADISPNTDANVFRIGAVVRVVPIKDIKTMLQSFSLVKREVPQAELYIIGPESEDEDYAAECKQLAASLQVRDVYFTGEVNVLEYLPRMDIMMLSSISEGQPLAILEAMAAGLPCVTTDVGSCKELLMGTDGDDLGPAGIVVPVMHYEQMAAAAIKLSRNAKLRQEMGRIGRERIRRRYTKESFIASYRRLYLECGGGSGGRSRV